MSRILTVISIAFAIAASLHYSQDIEEKKKGDIAKDLAAVTKRGTWECLDGPRGGPHGLHGYRNPGFGCESDRS